MYTVLNKPIFDAKSIAPLQKHLVMHLLENVTKCKPLKNSFKSSSHITTRFEIP